MIATYITTFKNLLARHLQPDVAIKTLVFPTPVEVLMVLTLNRDNQGGVEFRSECASTAEAFQRSGIDPDLLPEGSMTHKVGVCASSIVSLKSYDANNWTAVRAENLVKSIIKMINSAQKKMSHRSIRRTPKLAVD